MACELEQNFSLGTFCVGLINKPRDPLLILPHRCQETPFADKRPKGKSAKKRLIESAVSDLILIGSFSALASTKY